MAIYYFVFGILLFFSFLEQFTNIKFKVKKKIVLVVLLIFIFMSTIYNGDMGDYIGYSAVFNNRNSDSMFQGSYEPLYEFMSFLTRVFFKDYTIFRLVLAVLVMGIWYKIYKNENNAIIKNNVLTILTAMWALQTGPIFIVRSTIATVICIYSLRYIECKDKKKFVLCTIFAMGFHTMAILWFIAYKIYWEWKIHTLLNYCTSLMLIVATFRSIIIKALLSIIFFFPSRIEYKLNIYLNQDVTNTHGIEYSYTFILIKGLANMLLLIVIFHYLYIRIKKFANNNACLIFENYYKLYLFGTILYSIALPINISFARASLPFTTTSVFLLSYIFMLPENKKDIINRLCFFICYSLYLFIRMYSTLNGAQMNFVTIFS